MKIIKTSKPAFFSKRDSWLKINIWTAKYRIKPSKYPINTYKNLSNKILWILLTTLVEYISKKMGINGIIKINKNKILIFEKNDNEKNKPDVIKKLTFPYIKNFKK